MHRILGLAACAVALTVAGCTSAPASGAPSAPTAPAAASASPSAARGAGPATGKPIVMGDLADVTGAFALNGAEMHIATDLAVEQINAAGGINGRPLQVVYADPRSDPTQAVQLATQFVQQDNVDVLLGAVSSAECAAVAELAAKVGVVYVSQAGCASDEFTSKSCNKYTFRILPTGSQIVAPLTRYLVPTYGPNWGVMYSDYAYGQSQLRAYEAGLNAAGGQVMVRIPVPLGEANVTPYVTRTPTDGSINGLVATFSGSDEARIDSVIQQFGINTRMPIVGGGTREHYGGVYPSSLNGAISVAAEMSDAPPDNAFAEAFDRQFKDMAARQPEMAGKVGGPDKAIAGQSGYPAYVAVQALKVAMQAAGFSGRADSDKLVASLEKLDAPLGPDFPFGGVQMSASDHQGRSPVYIYKIDDQRETVLSIVPLEQVPAIGTCKV